MDTIDLHNDEVISGRDLIARLEELQEEWQDYKNDLEASLEHGSALDPDDERLHLSNWEDDNLEELTNLKDLIEGSYYDNCRDDLKDKTLVAKSFLSKYLEREWEGPTGWPYNHIDWEAAADERSHDLDELGEFYIFD